MKFRSLFHSSSVYFWPAHDVLAVEVVGDGAVFEVIIGVGADVVVVAEDHIDHAPGS